MHTTTFLSLLAGSALAAPTSDLFRRQQDCAYYPGQKDQATETYILRIDPVRLASNSSLSNPTATLTNGTLSNSTLTNSTTFPLTNTSSSRPLGYLDAFSTSHALLAPSRLYASLSFSAPTWSTNRHLIFWPSNSLQDYSRGFNIPPSALSSPSTIAPVISTPGCGTPFVELVSRTLAGDEDRGTCGLAGQRVRAQTGCPAFGSSSGNGGGEQCREMKFFVCERTGLQGISDTQKAVYYGVGETAEMGEGCVEVELVSECP
jgi:hypothetical protein